jgi:catechol 2,3-dioxygenase-like lactoylglutathione lyase family enzyme
VRVDGIVWMGVRSAAYEALRTLFVDVMGMEVAHDAAGVTWLDLPGGEQIQIYSDDDADHAFFTPGPTIGFRVDDFAKAYDELVAAGIEMIGDGDTDGVSRWHHFRGPDGNVYEIIGPLTEAAPQTRPAAR